MYFDSNQAGSSGGGIYIDVKNIDVRILHCIFTYHQSTDGAILYAGSQNKIQIESSELSFSISTGDCVFLY